MLELDYNISLSPFGSPRKLRRCKSKRYLGFIASKLCIVCGALSTVHHLIRGRTRNKRSGDLLTLPLCEKHHTGYEHGIDGRLGGNWAAFEKLHNLNIIEIVLGYWQEYFELNNWNGSFGSQEALDLFVMEHE